MNEWVWLIVIFALVFGLTFTTLMLVQSLMNRSRRRRKSEVQPRVDSEPELVLGPMTESLGATGTMTEEKRQTLRDELREAGFYRQTALMEYTAVRSVLVLFPLFVAGFLALAVEPEQMTYVLIGGLVVAVLGYSVPRLMINYWGRSRKRQIEHGLPVAVDLLALALSGGQNLLASLQRVSQELEISFPVLAQELQIVRRQAELRSLDHALEQLAERVNLDEVRNLSLILTQSERLGTDITTALHEFSNDFRLRIKQRAEARANRASFWMLFPTILFLWIPAGVILFAPIYYQFWMERQQSIEILNESRQGLQDIQGSPQDGDGLGLPGQ